MVSGSRSHEDDEARKRSSRRDPSCPSCFASFVSFASSRSKPPRASAIQIPPQIPDEVLDAVLFVEHGLLSLISSSAVGNRSNRRNAGVRRLLSVPLSLRRQASQRLQRHRPPDNNRHRLSLEQSVSHCLFQRERCGNLVLYCFSHASQRLECAHRLSLGFQGWNR